LVLRLSSFHGGLRFARPMSAMVVLPYPYPQRTALLAVTFVAAGALLAAAFGFGVIHAMRRTGSSLVLAAMAGVAALQAIVESLRTAVRLSLSPARLADERHLAAGGRLRGPAGELCRHPVPAQGARPDDRPGPGRGRSHGPAARLRHQDGLGADPGVALAALPAAAGVRARLPGARLTLAYLALFLGLALGFPEWLADLSYFLLAAGLVLPLLVVEVVRLGRDDRGREAALTRAASRPDRLTVASARGVELAPIAEILAVVGADDYVELRMVGGRSLLHAARLDGLTTQLPANFLRIHRSVIANLDHVQRLERDGDRWRLHLSEGAPLPVSRSRQPALREALDVPPPSGPCRPSGRTVTARRTDRRLAEIGPRPEIPRRDGRRQAHRLEIDPDLARLAAGVEQRQIGVAVGGLGRPDADPVLDEMRAVVARGLVDGDDLGIGQQGLGGASRLRRSPPMISGERAIDHRVIRCAVRQA
jgi:hypothetical protein